MSDEPRMLSTRCAMTNDSTFDRVRALVVRLAGPDRTPRAIGPDTPLGQGGFHLDSVELLEVMLACESELGMLFDGDLTANVEALQTLSTLTLAVRVRLGA
jgi:acyl carrier protein